MPHHPRGPRPAWRVAARPASWLPPSSCARRQAAAPPTTTAAARCPRQGRRCHTPACTAGSLAAGPCSTSPLPKRRPPCGSAAAASAPPHGASGHPSHHLPCTRTPSSTWPLSSGRMQSDRTSASSACSPAWWCRDDRGCPARGRHATKPPGERAEHRCGARHGCSERLRYSAEVLVLIHDRDRVESDSRLPRRSPVAVP